MWIRMQITGGAMSQACKTKPPIKSVPLGSRSTVQRLPCEIRRNEPTGGGTHLNVIGCRARRYDVWPGSTQSVRNEQTNPT
jgi:hypothetical protein